MTTDRAVRAVADVVAVDTVAPGLVEVITWSDSYMVDARDAGCRCPDKEYHGVPLCKHEYAALLADSDAYPTPYVTEVHERAVADGGERPDDCNCTAPETDSELPCHSCFQAGFTTVNPEVKP